VDGTGTKEGKIKKEELTFTGMMFIILLSKVDPRTLIFFSEISS